MEFEPGDMVFLKSGGPRMTVESVGDNYGQPTVWCVWFEQVGAKQVVKRETFPPVALKKAVDREQPARTQATYF